MPKSQNQMVLEHLRNHKGLTTYEAYTKYGITRLPSRICDLRKQGHIISSITKVEKNRYGRKVSFVEYRLVEEAREVL